MVDTHGIIRRDGPVYETPRLSTSILRAQFIEYALVVPPEQYFMLYSRVIWNLWQLAE
jgi:hypothetical protein